MPVTQQGVDEYFNYEICRINIDESNPNHVKMEMMQPVLLMTGSNIAVTSQYDQSPLILGFTGVSCMVAKFDAFGFTQVDGVSEDTIKNDKFFLYQ
jgi:hypothetical protein